MKYSAVLDSLSPEQAQAVLMKLAAGDAQIHRQAEEIAIALLGDVDVDELAEEVFCELDSIAVEDVWDNSGQKCDGYVDPGEYACQLFEEALEPFTRQMEKCGQLSLEQAAKHCCMGILKGIHEFDQESTTEFKSWAVDAPGDYFVQVYEQWKGNAKKKDVSEVKAYVRSLDAQWARLCK